MMDMYGHKDQVEVPDGDDDTGWSDEILAQAADALGKRVAVNRAFDVIYLAGTSSDGRIIYVDRDLPETIEMDGEDCPIDRYLIVHELVEQALMSKLNLKYQLAHQLALRAERAAVEADGYEWEEYSAFMDEWAARSLKKKDPESPPDLDSKPYVDEKDDVALKRMDKEHLIPREDEPNGGAGAYPVPSKPQPMEVVVVKKPKRKYSA